MIAGEIEDNIRAGRDVYIEDSSIEGDLNLGFRVAVRISILRTEINGNVYCYNAIFEREVRIIDCTFRKKANFEGAKFEEKTSFSDSNFHIHVSFQNAVFEKESSFNNVKFQEDADFSGVKTRFAEKASFDTARFSNRAQFNSANFRGESSFNGADFSGYADFNSVIFRGISSFNSAKFLGVADYDFASFRETASFDSAVFTERASFANASVNQPASFANIDFKENTVLNGLWNEVILRMASVLLRFAFPVFLFAFMILSQIEREKQRRNGYPEMEFSRFANSYTRSREVINAWLTARQAKVTDFYNLSTYTVMDSSSNPYLRRYIEDEQWLKSWRNRGGWWKKFLFFFWEASSHCGRSFSLWLVWAVALVLGFAILYNFVFGPNETITLTIAKSLEARNLPTKPDFWAYIYFSVVTFTTLGFGDIVPLTGWARFAVWTEVAFGYYMLGVFLTIITNRFARQS